MTTRTARRSTLLLCAMALSVMPSSGLAAVNLLTNPSLDSDLAGWTVLSGSAASWSPVDATGNVNSGSALVVNKVNPSVGGAPLALAQCLNVSPSTKYSFGGRLTVPVAQPADTRAFVFAEFFASVGCAGTYVGNVQLAEDDVGEWKTSGTTITTDPGVHSVRVSLGVSKPVGVTANASAQFDDLYFQQSASGGPFAIGPYMSASWYDPAQSGHGIQLELLDGASAWMCWFTFDLAGNRAWICSLGSVGGVTIDFAEAFVVQGGRFPPLFDPQQIVEVPWGSITVTFSGCDSGTMTWTTTAAGFQSGSMPLSRLTTLWGNACQ